jgi:hypothetical protein
MKTQFTISLTKNQARELEASCAARPGVHPEGLIEAWVADKLDLERLGTEGARH